MIQQDIEKKHVTLDVARKLKDKGFDQPCQAYFDGDNGDKFTYVPYNETNSNNHTWLSAMGGKEGRGKGHVEVLYNRTSAPTYQEAFDWLREVQNTHVEIIAGGSPKKYCVFVGKLSHGYLYAGPNEIAQFDYDVARVEGILFALKNI